ncbi:MAG: DUF58 domain-containing protein [Thermoplasmata archaeon]
MTSSSDPSGTWSARTWLFYGSAGMLLLLAIILHDPVPLFAAVPLLLAPLAVFLSAPNDLEPIELRWEEGGSQGTVALHGTMELPTGVDSRRIVLELPVPPDLMSAAPPRIARGAHALEFWADWIAAEPLLTVLHPPRVHWEDPLGLLRVPLTVHGPALPLERYPPDVGRLGAMRLRRTIVYPGETRSPALGASGEFHGLRPTVAGDSARQINWPAVARTGRMFSNEFLLERAGDVLLLLDARASPLGPEVDERLLGVMRAAAAGISAAFLHEKSRVGLAVFGEFADVIPLGSGRAQRFRIRETLLRAKVVTRPGPSERMAVITRRQFPFGPTTILMSSLASDNADLLVLHLRRRGFAPIVLSASPIAVWPHTPGISMDDAELATRIARLARRQQVARVWRTAPVIDWSEFWSLAGFTHFLAMGGGERRRT